MASTYAVTGATGFIGGELVRSLSADGHRVLRLTRSPRDAQDVHFDPAQDALDPARLEGVDAVVHLAGESIGGLWTKARKRRIRDSRVGGTTLLARTLAALTRKPRVLVSTSAIGFYGSRGDEVLTEESVGGHGFLADVCRAWEAAAQPAKDAGVRVVHPRFGLVLDPAGGALRAMLPAFRLGLGGPLGDGRQWSAWVTRRDVVRALRRLADDETLDGPVLVTSPEPVTNATFARELASALSRPAILRVPAFALRALLDGLADEGLLASQRAVPARLTAIGFEFAHPRLRETLRSAEFGLAKRG